MQEPELLNSLDETDSNTPVIPPLPEPAVRRPGIHTYLFLCKKCGWHMDCADKQQLADIKKHHKMRGCDWGCVQLKSGRKIYVRDEIAREVRDFLDAARKQQEKERAKTLEEQMSYELRTRPNNG